MTPFIVHTRPIEYFMRKPENLINFHPFGLLRWTSSLKHHHLFLFRMFLESEWCLFEFQTALAELLTDQVHKIIIIKTADLPGDIDSSIETYLRSTTYLTWGEEDFWRKLLSSLPSGGRSGNSCPRNRRMNEALLFLNL